MADIFNYLEYRDFLRDTYQELKKEKPFFSYRFIGQKVDLHSSYVIKILQGALHIAPNKIENFIKLLNLNEVEADYFEALVHFGRAKTERQRKLYFDRLFQISTVKAKRLDLQQYEFFRKWHYSAVWSLLNCRPFAGNYKQLAGQCQPPIAAAEARQAVKLLETLGLIAKNEAGAWATTENNLTTGQKWQSQAVTAYQKDMMRLGMEALGRFQKQDRDISTVTLCVDESNLPEVREHIRLFRSSLIKLVNSQTPSNRVFQLNVQLFPLTAAVDGKGTDAP